MELIIFTLAFLLVSCLLIISIRYPDTISHLCNNFLREHSFLFTLTKAMSPTSQTNSPVASKNIKGTPEIKTPKRTDNNPEDDPMSAEKKSPGTQNHR